MTDLMPREVGEPRRYVQGAGTYVSDYASRTRAPAAFVVRSETPNARLTNVGLDAVRAAEGVLGAFSAADILADLGRVPVIEPRISASPDLVPYLQPVIATDRVRFVGEPVAVVVAEDRYVAEDAAALMELDMDSLEPVLDLRAAARAEPLFGGGNEVSTIESSFGDVREAFAAADAVVDLEIAVGRHSGVPMETRGLVADALPTGRLEIVGAAKVLHANRRMLAEMLGMAPSSIRMRELDVGGGFGIRGEFYPEDFLIPWAARRLGTTVCWVEDRREHLVAANQSRQQLHSASIAADRSGRFLGIKTEFHIDSGAYVRTVGLRVADLSLGEIPGPYRFGSYRGVAHCVVSNRTPTGTYRSPGRFESSFVRERLIDALAEKLAMTPRELRRRNLVAPGDMPYESGLRSAGKAVALRNGDFPALFARVADTTERTARDRRAAGARPGTRLGHAVACFVEKSGLGPYEDARVTLAPDGRFEVRTGASYLGQGLDQALVSVVASRVGVPKDRVAIARVDTSEIEEGIGTYASRSLIMSGGAVAGACDLLVERGRAAVARRLGVAPDAVELREGQFRAGPASCSWEELAGEGLEATHRFEKDAVTYGFGAHGAVVAVDERTGIVRVEDLVLGYDVGNAIDETVVRGQLQGAAMQALGGALLEEFAYDPSGNPTSTTFMDYLMPTASEAPRMEVLLDHSIPDDNPLGARGAGEAGVPAVAAAIAAAIERACGCGAALTTTPIHPEDVLDRCLAERSTAS